MEQFMLESGIRQYCTEVCKGECCGECYSSEFACHRNEGRRLKCSYYVCVDLLKNVFSVKEAVEYRLLGSELNAAILKASYDVYRNPYFVPYPKSMMDRFQIEAKFFELYLPPAAGLVLRIAILPKKLMRRGARI